MDVRLDEKVVLITGGSKGIGKAIAREFLLSGASVMLTSRKAEGLAAAAQELRTATASAGGTGTVSWMAGNAGDPTHAGACVGATLEQFGRIDVLVNNAAANPYMGPMIDIDVPRAEKTVTVNQLGYLVWSNLVWHAWMKDSGGAILNIASVGGLSVEREIGYYNVTKAAVLQMTRQLAYELAPRVRVNAIAPGLVKTDFARALWEPNEAKIARKWPLGRLGEPDDVASAAVFLCSDRAAWITGAQLVVDGGAMTSPALS